MALKRKATAKKKLAGRSGAAAKRAGARKGGGGPSTPVPPGRTFYVLKGSNVSKAEIEKLLEQGVPLRVVNLSKIAPSRGKSKLKKNLSKTAMAAGVIYTLNAPFKVRPSA